MLKELFLIAKQGAKAVYDNYEYKVWTTEFSLKTTMVNSGIEIQRLDIGGTKGFFDWIPNTLLLSWKGYKIGDWWSAKRIKNSKYFKAKRDLRLPLLITGHSKGGGSAVVFMHAFGNKEKDWCVPFNAPPVLRSWIDKNMPRTYMFFNTHDVVSDAGEVNFDHPIPEKEYFNKQDLGDVLDNHNIDQWDDFINNIEDLKSNWWEKNHPEKA